MVQKWITPGEVAEQLGVDVATVKRWLREGKLPEAQRLPGGAYRLPADTARRLLKPAIPERVA
jgi:excisionase family DNA binding protein